MRKEISQAQEDLRDYIKENLEYIDDELKVHFSFEDIYKFHLDFIEDYVSHMHVRGTFENGCMEITSISNHITHSNSQAILEMIAQAMNEVGYEV